MRSGVGTATVQPTAPSQQAPQNTAEATPPDSEVGALEQVCKGHIWKLDVYGL